MMNLKMKNAVSFFLALLMLFGVFSGTVFAEGETVAAADSAAADSDGIDMPSAPSSVSNKSLDDVKSILSAYSYSEYLDSLEDTTLGKDVIQLTAAEGYEYTPSSLSPDDVCTVEDVGEGKEKREGVLVAPQNGTVTWSFNVENAGLYTMDIDYCPTNQQNADIERILKINGTVPYSEARYLTMTKAWKDDFDFENTENGFESDNSGNELRPSKHCEIKWQTYHMKDSTGYFTGALQFYLEKGENTLSLESSREAVAIDTITIRPTDELISYDKYLKNCQKKGAKEISADAEPIRVEAETPKLASNATIFPTYDRTSCITSPQDYSRIRYNTLGSASTWTKIGTWVEWTMEVPEDGLYNIYTRFRQSVAVDKFVSRCLTIDGEIPFKEAESLRFGYSDEWQVQALGNHRDPDNDVNYLFYFEKGHQYTVRMEVVLGDMSTLLNSISELVDPLNEIYLKILQITGAQADTARDYGFMELIPDYLDMMLLQSTKLYDIVDQFVEINGYLGSETKTLQEIAKLLRKMGSDEDEIAKNFATLKTNIGTLGTWIHDALEQPLELDYFSLQGPETDAPQVSANAFQSLGFEFKQFVASFYSSYSNFSTGYSKNSADFVTVWFTGGRDQAQVYKRMLDDSFTPESGIDVVMKFTTADAILPAMLAGVGPDVSDMASAECINWAIRGALLPIDFDDKDEVLERFSDEASIPFTLYNYDIETDSTTETLYGIPTTMTFNMMYYRMDVLSDLNLTVPDTWSELRSMLPVLQANHMDIGAPDYASLYATFLYQQGGEYWADGGMRIGLDNTLNLSCFQDACEIYTQYNFPLAFDFTNRFRTGEMPVGFASYTAVTTLNVFATEIRGLWEFTTIPGMITTDDAGNEAYNNVNVATFAGVSILRGCGNKDSVWEYLKWWTDEPQQTRYGNELESILGIGTRYETSNIESIKNQPWNTAEANKITAQLYNLKTTPEYPGSYIIARYVSFAFNHAYNDSADPVDSVLSYIPYINKEINRKRKEFDMDTIDIGSSLAELREKEAASKKEN